MEWMKTNSSKCSYSSRPRIGDMNETVLGSKPHACKLAWFPNSWSKATADSRTVEVRLLSLTLMYQYGWTSNYKVPQCFTKNPSTSEWPQRSRWPREATRRQCSSSASPGKQDTALHKQTHTHTHTITHTRNKMLVDSPPSSNDQRTITRHLSSRRKINAVSNCKCSLDNNCSLARTTPTSTTMQYGLCTATNTLCLQNEENCPCIEIDNSLRHNLKCKLIPFMLPVTETKTCKMVMHEYIATRT